MRPLEPLPADRSCEVPLLSLAERVYATVTAAS
jgi:hypothetical protein